MKVVYKNTPRKEGRGVALEWLYEDGTIIAGFWGQHRGDVEIKAFHIANGGIEIEEPPEWIYNEASVDMMGAAYDWLKENA